MIPVILVTLVMMNDNDSNDSANGNDDYINA